MRFLYNIIELVTIGLTSNNGKIKYSITATPGPPLEFIIIKAIKTCSYGQQECKTHNKIRRIYNSPVTSLAKKLLFLSDFIQP